ncbi:MAG: PorP/SprF family type IX secretion system membrane protein [Anditalea sp.]
MKTFIAFYVVMLVFGFSGKAQDFHYSQFYAAPLYLNPALTGSTELSRFGINYRKQWPGLTHDFNAYSAYFDHYSFDLNSGMGMAINSFQESNMKINTSDVSLFYAYKLKLAANWDFRFGGQASVVQRNATLDNLIFGDQVNLFSRSINPNTIDLIPDFEPYSYLDISFGALVNHDFFWLGGAAHHINQPNLSFYPDNELIYLPVKWGIQGGLNFPLEPNGYSGTSFESQASILLSYKKQGPFQQFDFGGQIIHQTVLGGISYRGIPGLRNMPNQDSIIFLLGVMLNNGIVIGYSYDFMVSNIGTQTKGAHEISLRYLFFMGEPRNRNQRSRILKCFDYMM